MTQWTSYYDTIYAPSMPNTGTWFMDGYLPYKYITQSSYLYNVTICVNNSNNYMLTGIQMAWKRISTGVII